VIDRNGRVVGHRKKGDASIVKDGEGVRVRMNMMDGADPALSALLTAAALADSVKRNEQFDARGHRPGYVIDRPADADTARDQYHARTRDAWKTPPSATVEDTTLTPIEKVAVLGPQGTTDAERRAAADRVIADRDKRISEAWKS
jgi:hypothetical protein